MNILTITHPKNGGFTFRKNNNHPYHSKTYMMSKDKAIEQALKDFNLKREETIILESRIR